MDGLSAYVKLRVPSFGPCISKHVMPTAPQLRIDRDVPNAETCELIKILEVHYLQTTALAAVLKNELPWFLRYLYSENRIGLPNALPRLR